MNWKKLGIATAAGAAAMLVLGGLWEGISGRQFFYTQAHYSLESNFVLIVAYLLLGAMMAYAYPHAKGAARPTWRACSSACSSAC